jgi:hypothetical protein
MFCFSWHYPGTVRAHEIEIELKGKNEAGHMMTSQDRVSILSAYTTIKHRADVTKNSTGAPQKAST